MLHAEESGAQMCSGILFQFWHSSSIFICRGLGTNLCQEVMEGGKELGREEEGRGCQDDFWFCQALLVVLDKGFAYSISLFTSSPLAYFY